LLAFRPFLRLLLPLPLLARCLHYLT
jgi:hypothetical protein